MVRWKCWTTWPFLRSILISKIASLTGGLGRFSLPLSYDSENNLKWIKLFLYLICTDRPVDGGQGRTRGERGREHDGHRTDDDAKCAAEETAGCGHFWWTTIVTNMENQWVQKQTLPHYDSLTKHSYKNSTACKWRGSNQARWVSVRAMRLLRRSTAGTILRRCAFTPFVPDWISDNHLGDTNLFRHACCSCKATRRSASPEWNWRRLRGLTG